MEKEIREYLARTKEIRTLSSPFLKDVHKPEDYSRILRENFVRIGTLAAENREMIIRVMEPMLRAGEPVEEPIVRLLDDLMNGLYDAYRLENIDSSLADLISERLMECAEAGTDRAALIRQMDTRMDAVYAMLVKTRRIMTKPEMALDYQQKGVSLSLKFRNLLTKEQMKKLPDNECRLTVLTDARYSHCFREMVGTLSGGKDHGIQNLLEMLELEKDEEIRALVPEYDWVYHRLRTLEYIGMLTEYGNSAMISPEEAVKIRPYVQQLRAEWEQYPETGRRVISEDRLRLVEIRADYYAGMMDREACLSALYQLYLTRKESGSDTACLEIPLEYMLILGNPVPENVPDSGNAQPGLTEEHIGRLTEMYRSLMEYLLHLHSSGTDLTVLEIVSFLLIRYIEVPEIPFEQMSLTCMLALHPPTYLHSNMVADITKCLTEHLLSQEPERFIGFLNCRTKEEVLEKREEILSFAYHAALCHDVGKLPMIDTVFVYERQLSDLEFGIIREHPELGRIMLERNASTKAYSPIALGHHRWYNNQGGYPRSCDLDALPERTIIDIVSCADCMDAATDSVGRSYNRGKTLDEYLEEFRNEQGTRYAPYLADLMDRPEVYKDLCHLVETVREEHYRKTYERFF